MIDALCSCVTRDQAAMYRKRMDQKGFTFRVPGGGRDSIFEARPSRYKCDRIIESLGVTMEEPGCSIGVAKALFSRLLYLPIEQIPDNHPEAPTLLYSPGRHCCTPRDLPS